MNEPKNGNLRLTLTSYASELVRAEAGDEKPDQKHLDQLLERLLAEASTATSSTLHPPADNSHVLESILAILVRMQSICLGGFYAQAGEAQEALLEFSRFNIASVRQAVEEAQLDKSRIEKEIAHSERELRMMSPALDLRERESGDRERD